MRGMVWQQKKPVCMQSGFTLIELLTVVGIVSILLTIATFGLVHSQQSASVSATVDVLVSDLHTQQTRAMAGTNDTTGNPNSYGISFTSSGYKLFQGTSDPNDSTDFAVNPTGITFTTNLPNNMIDFSQRSGMFGNYVAGTTYTISIKNTNGTQQRVLTINKYGVVTDNQLQ